MHIAESDEDPVIDQIDPDSPQVYVVWYTFGDRGDNARLHIAKSSTYATYYGRPFEKHTLADDLIYNGGYVDLSDVNTKYIVFTDENSEPDQYYKTNNPLEQARELIYEYDEDSGYIRNYTGELKYNYAVNGVFKHSNNDDEQSVIFKANSSYPKTMLDTDGYDSSYGYNCFNIVFVLAVADIEEFSKEIHTLLRSDDSYSYSDSD